MDGKESYRKALQLIFALADVGSLGYYTIMRMTKK